MVVNDKIYTSERGLIELKKNWQGFVRIDRELAWSLGNWQEIGQANR
jgi:hypothetical protein